MRDRPRWGRRPSATAVSPSLQHGVPLKVLVEKFAPTRFEPSGWTGNEHIGFAKSIMDYIFRWLQLRLLSGHQLSLFSALAGGTQRTAAPALAEEPLRSASGLETARYETRPPASGIVPEPGALGQAGAGRGSAETSFSPSFTMPVASDRRGHTAYEMQDSGVQNAFPIS
jgi:ribonucleoside-diphosphate reductase alpha chain